MWRRWTRFCWRCCRGGFKSNPRAPSSSPCPYRFAQSEVAVARIDLAPEFGICPPSISIPYVPRAQQQQQQQRCPRCTPSRRSPSTTPRTIAGSSSAARYTNVSSPLLRASAIISWLIPDPLPVLPLPNSDPRLGSLGHNVVMVAGSRLWSLVGSLTMSMPRCSQRRQSCFPQDDSWFCIMFLQPVPQACRSGQGYWFLLFPRRLVGPVFAL